MNSDHDAIDARRPTLAIGSAHQPLDPLRARSQGVLDENQRHFCLLAGIPIAYDPIQLGWVTEACLDDFALESPTHPAARPELVRVVRELEQAGHRALRDATRRGDADDGEALAARLFALAAERVGALSSLPPVDRLELLRRAQSHARAWLATVRREDRARARRRHEALARGHRFRLRAWSPEDADRFLALLDDAEVWRHLPETRPSPFTRSDALDMIEISNLGTHHEVRAIELDGEVVGQVRMLWQGRWNDVAAGGVDAEISYWLGRPYWGLGLARDLVPLATLLAFRKWPLASVFARIHVDNVASWRAAERAGFRDEGALAAELEGDPTVHTLRCHRIEYMDPGPRSRGVRRPVRAPVDRRRPGAHVSAH